MSEIEEKARELREAIDFQVVHALALEYSYAVEPSHPEPDSEDVTVAVVRALVTTLGLSWDDVPWLEDVGVALLVLASRASDPMDALTYHEDEHRAQALSRRLAILLTAAGVER